MDTNVNNTDTDCDDDLELGTNPSETQILTWKTLIDVVRANPVLYKKKHKGFPKKSDKFLIWARIGASLIPPMTGTDTEKEFYRLRQKFGKERRKVLQSQTKSGAGENNMIYKPNWILYNDLMFLTDHIQPRQSSKHQRSVAVHQKIPNLQTSQQLVISTPLTCTPSPSYYKSSDFWNTFESMTESTPVEGERLSSKADSEDSCLSVVLTSSKSSISSDNASPSALKTADSTNVSQTPPLDKNKKRKRSSTDKMNIVMMESSKSVSLLSSILQNVLKEKISTPQQLVIPEVSPEVQTMLGSIAIGLSKVPVECQIDCLIRILSCITEFAKK